jgi:hypothetical protein
MSATNYFPRWYYPTSVDQTFEDVSHIPWDSTGNFVHLKSKDLSRTSTVAPLKHIPVSRTVSIRNKTWFLHCRFQLGTEPGQINGIQVQIQMDRGSRIVDDTIQLDKNGELLGENQATLDILSLKTYGNTWGLNWSNIDPYTLTSGNFGLRLRFQSNFNTPHTTTPSIDFIRMRYTVVGEDLINKQEALPNIGWTMALTLEKIWDRTESSDGRKELKPKLKGGSGLGNGFGLEGDGEGAGGSGGPGVAPPDPNLPTNPTGSFGFIGSSYRFDGSFGFVGSGGSFGFVGSGASNITSISTLPSIQFLPSSAPRFEGYLIQNTGQLFYWDNVWILAASL